MSKTHLIEKCLDIGAARVEDFKGCPTVKYVRGQGFWIELYRRPVFFRNSTQALEFIAMSIEAGRPVMSAARH